MFNAFLTAIIFGLVTLLIGYLMYAMVPYSKMDGKVSELQYHLIMLFILGFLSFLLLYIVGFNKWHCNY